MVKVVEQSLQRYATSFSHSIAPLLREHCREILAVLNTLKLRLTTIKGSDAALLSTLRAACGLAERLTQTTEVWDQNRLDVLDFACRVAARKGMLKDDQQQALARLQWMVAVLSDWQARIRTAANCRFVCCVRCSPLLAHTCSMYACMLWLGRSHSACAASCTASAACFPRCCRQLRCHRTTYVCLLLVSRFACLPGPCSAATCCAAEPPSAVRHQRVL